MHCKLNRRRRRRRHRARFMLACGLFVHAAAPRDDARGFLYFRQGDSGEGERASILTHVMRLTTMMNPRGEKECHGKQLLVYMPRVFFLSSSSSALLDRQLCGVRECLAQGTFHPPFHEYTRKAIKTFSN